MSNLGFGDDWSVGVFLDFEFEIAEYLDITPTTATSTTLIGDYRKLGSPTYVSTIQGTGFTYNASGMPFAGTINRLTDLSDGKLVFDWSALDVSVGSFTFWAQQNNPSEAVRTMLGGSDNISGTLFHDTLNGHAGNDRIDGRAGRDRISGGDGGDLLIGGADADTLTGDSGDDTLEGGPGADDQQGVGGYDMVTYANAGGGVSVNLDGSNGWSGEATGDRFGSIEILRGSRFADILIGSNDHNVIEGGPGADTIAGLAGNDWLSFENATGAIAINLDSGAGWAGDATGDLVSGIENLRGTPFGDYLFGDTGANILRGDAGPDVLYGGANSDTIYYSTSAQAVVVDLSTNSASGGDAEGDTLVSVENVFATAFGDTLIGDSASNTLVGWLGVDRLTGNGGNDIFRWSALNESGVGPGARDVVTDFVRAHGDLLDVSGIDADTTTSGNQTFNFNGGAAFTTAGQLRCFSTGAGTTIVELNVNADLAADMQIELAGTIALIISDVLL